MKNKKNADESKFSIPEFKELPESDKKKVINLLNKKVKINFEMVSDGTKKHQATLENKFPNSEAVITHIYYNGEIRIESTKHKNNHMMVNYKVVEKVLK